MTVASLAEYKRSKAGPDTMAGAAVAGLPPIADADAELDILLHALRMCSIAEFADVLPSVEAFATGSYRRLYALMLAAHESGQTIAIDAIFAQLRAGAGDASAHSLVREIGDAFADRAALPPGKARPLALELRRVWARRRVAALAIEIEARAYHPREGDTAQTLMSELVDGIASVESSIADTSGNVSARDATRALAASWKAPKERAPRTGIPTVDRCIHDLAPRRTTVIAARTSVGKSILAQEVSLSAARQGAGVFYVSLEMDVQSLAARMIAAMSGVNSRIIAGKQPGDVVDKAKAVEHAQIFASLPLEIWPSQSATMADIYRGAEDAMRSFASRGGALGVVVIDHIGLVRPANSREPRHEQIARVSRDARLLADKLGVHVLLLAQCNREAEKVRGKAGASTAPQMHQIAESDKIANDADNVLILHAPRDASGQWAPTASELIIAKARDGGIGECEVRIQRECQRIRELGADAGWE